MVLFSLASKNRTEKGKESNQITNEGGGSYER
jgi:hypothetical protein